MALSRLRRTERNLKKADHVAEDCEATFQAYVKKGYPRKVSSDEQLPNNIWYLPHFPIVRMDKTTTNLRIVSDCTAKCNGIESVGSRLGWIHARVRRVLHNLLSRVNRKAGIELSPKGCWRGDSKLCTTWRITWRVHSFELGKTDTTQKSVDQANSCINVTSFVPCSQKNLHRAMKENLAAMSLRHPGKSRSLAQKTLVDSYSS